MLPSAAAAIAPDSVLVRELLAVSLTGIIFYTPIYDPAGAGEVVDFTFEYLNPAAQRMMRMPEVPAVTHNQQWPHSIEHGTFQFHVDAFVSGEPREHNVNYQADGYNNYYRLAARRAGDGLLVSFTDTADQPRSPVEMALRESQARERALLAEAEQERVLLKAIVTQAPVGIGLFQGEHYRVTLANNRICEMFGRPAEQVLNRPLLEAVPELRGQGFTELLDEVGRTGTPFIGTEVPAQLQQHGQLTTRYFNFAYQPVYDAEGQLLGIYDLAVDVTEQVTARRQLEQLNRELEARVTERTEAALALQADLLAAAKRQAEERALLYQVFHETPAAICIQRGPDHRYEYANPAYEAFFPGRELLGRTVAEALPETVESGVIALLDQVYQTGETYYGEELPLLIAQPEGPPRQMYFTFTYQAIRENRKIVGISTFAYNVAEQVLARQQREAERQQLHNLFMEAPAPIVILDGPALVYQLVNLAYQRIFPGRTLLGKPLLDALPEMAGIPLLQDLREVYRTGETFVAQELPLRLARHDGGPLEEIYWTFTYQARRTAHGAVDGVLVFAHEVTDQVQARRVVEARETSFRLLADNVPGTLWVTNPAGECTYLNARWYATTGQTQTEGLGLGWTDAVHPDDAAGAGAAFLEANARREPFNYLFRLRQRDGGYRWVTDQGRPRFGAAGAYDGMVGAVVDVHEQKLAELALQRLTEELRTSRDEAQALAEDLSAANEQLTRTNVDLDNFIYTASHDLKAPISNIEGLLYLLQEELPAAVTQGAHVGPTLTRMLDAVERFKRTINHLTDVSKLQKEHAPASASVNLAAVVEDVRQDLAPLLQETGAKLVVDVTALPPVQFSEKNLRSVVYNLLSNAVKYHSPDRAPRVDVRAHVRPDHTVLEVHDNGLGIAPAHLPRLFAMFQRFHDHVDGSGIGLYMVKRMVENAGGRIEVHSRLGAGTTFFVHLPHAAAPAAA
ncbi:MAG TPA: PAS domain-containing protein [Hymenobacter sp.]